MTKEEAKEALFFHSGRHDDVRNPRWEKGFLGSLRPFQGELFEENYHEVVLAIRTLAEDLQQPNIDREIMASILGICHLGRAWALYPNGMLRGNKLISQDQMAQIENWIEQISYITFCLLDGCDEAVAFEFYDDESE